MENMAYQRSDSESRCILMPEMSRHLRRLLSRRTSPWEPALMEHRSRAIMDELEVEKRSSQDPQGAMVYMDTEYSAKINLKRRGTTNIQKQ
jgi:hypothetical protein